MASLKCDIILFPAIIIYIVCLITEIVSSVPLGLLQSDFGGNCILNGKVSFNYTFAYFSVEKFSSNTICHFCTYLTVPTVLFCLIYAAYTIYALYKSMENAKQMWVLPALLITVLLFILKLASASIVSIGKKNICKSIKESSKLECNKVSKIPFMYGTKSADSSHLFSYLTTSESASWFCILWWVIIVILTGLHYRRNIKSRSQPDRQGVVNKTFQE